MTIATTTDLSAAELTQRAEALLDVLRRNAAQTEADRRVVEENIQGLADADLLKLTVPKRYGGLEVPFSSFLSVTSTLGQACGSTAWVTTLLNVCNWLVGVFPEQAQDEVFGANPDARVCGVIAPNATTEYTDGGLRVTGKWGFASGSHHAQWAVLGVPVVDESGAQVDQGLALIPMEELSVEDTWFVAGMSGTGSNTLVADDVFVPSHRIISLSRGLEGVTATEHQDEALYRAPLVPVFALVLIGPLLGLAKGALNQVKTSLAKGKGISYTFYEHADDSGSTQLNMAQAASLIDTAELHMYRAAADIDDASHEPKFMSTEMRARVRMDTGVVATRAREAMDMLLSVQGAGSFGDFNPLQRQWRDLETGSRHAVINPSIAAEAYGRILLGVDEPVTPML